MLHRLKSSRMEREKQWDHQNEGQKASSTALECRKESFGKLNYGMDEEMEKKAFLNTETKVGKVLLDRGRNEQSN